MCVIFDGQYAYVMFQAPKNLIQSFIQKTDSEKPDPEQILPQFFFVWRYVDTYECKPGKSCCLLLRARENLVFPMSRIKKAHKEANETGLGIVFMEAEDLNLDLREA